MSHSSMDDMNLNAPHSMGTTIIGVTYDGGVVLGADSCTSTGQVCTWRIVAPIYYGIIESVLICLANFPIATGQ